MGKHDSPMQDHEEEEDQEEVTMEAEEEQEEVDEEEVSAPAATPAGKRAATGAFDEDDDDMEDTRLTRLDEKSELQGLNKRLEFYILKQRERDASADAWGRELANLKNKHAADLEHQKNLFENQLGIVRKNRDELSAKLSKLEGESAQSETHTTARFKSIFAPLWVKTHICLGSISRIFFFFSPLVVSLSVLFLFFPLLFSKDNLLSELQARVSSEHKARTSLESRVEMLSKELMTSQTSVNSLQNKFDHLKHEFQALQVSHGDLEKSLDASRTAQEQAQSRANKLQQQYTDLKDEYDTLQARHAADGKKYDKQIHDLCLENNKSVETIRTDCENRLNALFAERQYQYDKDKTDSLSELKNSYDAKLYGYRTRLEELGHELEGERAQLRATTRNLEKEMKYGESLRSEIAILQARILALEKALEAEKTNPDLLKQLHEKNETIKRVKAAFKRKDAEFDELMDVKIMLDMEIKSYRSLLDQEDLRLGALPGKESANSYSTTTTTTTTTSSSSSSSTRKSSKRTSEEDAQEEEDRSSKKRRRSSARSDSKSKNGALLFSRNDSNGQYVAMTNNSDQRASLNGWILRAPRHGIEFRFPDVGLESGGTFFVVSGTQPKTLGEEDQVAQWPMTLKWDTTAEDTAELVAPSGVVVASVVVAPEGEQNNAAAAQGKANGNNQCAIM